MPAPRRCILLRGDPQRTAEAAERLLAAQPADAQLWISDDPPCPSRQATPPKQVKRLLGRAYDAVVLDLHRRLDPDLLAAAQGFLWGGGALLLRLPPPGPSPLAARAPLAVPPYPPQAVGDRLWQRLEAHLAAAPCVEHTPPARPLAPLTHHPQGSRAQARVVDALVAQLRAPEPACVALMAGRGRGKSSALGLALRRLRAERPRLRVAVTAADPLAAAELLRFAEVPTTCPDDQPLFTPALDLLHGDPAYDLLLIDEAAQLPVPLLQRLTLAHPRAHLAFATTTHGYEGTGRGFVLRFLAWAERQPRPLLRLHLDEPIRWSAGDPVERLIDDLLCLDAAIPDLQDTSLAPTLTPTPAPRDSYERAAPRPPARAAPPEFEPLQVDRDRLAADEPALRQLFGLLVHAHYRTTPADLHRLLDAPNLDLHALRWRGQIVAATLIAREGELPPATCEALAAGAAQLRGHALADTLITHSLCPQAGALTLIRSVRIAVHPQLRRRGLATRLIEHVHAAYPHAHLFGTLFGATPELLAFRRALGYQLVRVGVARGSRTGEPAAVMIRPTSPAAGALVHQLRHQLAHALPTQLHLLSHDGELHLDPELDRSLRADLPHVDPPDDPTCARVVARYAASAQPYELIAHALIPWLRRRSDHLAHLTPTARAVVEARVLRGDSWPHVARIAGLPSAGAAMRALRPAIRALLATEPSPS
jgi:tRNA(Met) cytidine acetyltransferase